jgi:bifunctional DNase/RNase
MVLEATMTDMVEVVIDSIRVGLMSQQRVVILRETEAERYLAIWIDPYMAEQITYALQEVDIARPMTHDLMKSILRSLDVRVLRVEVTSLQTDVFYGNIVIEYNGRSMNIPILVSSDVMDDAGIIPEEDMEAEDVTETSDEEEVIDRGPDEEQRLSVFDDFLDNLEVDEGDEEEE